MSLCINPHCPQPNHPDNGSSRTCQACGAELLLQGRYRVMRLISNQSGFGQVYEAYERNIPKLLKILKQVYNDNPKALELFQREAQVLSRLSHPGLPKVEADGYFQYRPVPDSPPLHCLVMEKIDGPNLRQWMIQQGNHPISEQQAILWLAQLTDVLHLVHQQNYFHRDIKPENIMLRSTGQLVLVDFGSAREMTSTYVANLGDSGITAVSSAGYTPPEQEQGQAVLQSDFFAMGRTLVYLLTARIPNDPAIYDSRTNAFNWRPYATPISPTLADLIDDLIAPRAIDRPQTTQAILERLTLVRSIQPTFPPKPNGHLPPQPWAATTLDPPSALPTANGSTPATAHSSRSLVPWLVGGLAVGTLLIGLGIWSQILRQPTATNLPSTTSPATSIQQVKVSPVNTLPGHTGDILDLLLLKDGQTAITASADETIRLWDLTNGAELARLEGHTSIVKTLALTPDQEVLVSAGTDRSIRFWSLDTRQQIAVITDAHDSPINSIAIDPSGRLLASASAGGDIKLWDLATRDLITTLNANDGLINSLIFTRDGRHLASGGQTLHLWDLQTKTDQFTLTGHDSFINRLAVSSDNRTLISASADRTIRLWDLSTGKLEQTLEGHTSYVNDLVIDGPRLWSASEDQTIRVWDLNTGRAIQELTGFDIDIYRFAIQPNGRLVTVGGKKKNVYIWVPDLS